MSDPLHIKYRPTKFDEVVGHDDIVNSFELALINKRSKAYLFIGGSGLGKTTLARIGASVICGDKATSANVIEVDAATHTGVDAMRDLASSLVYRALGSTPKKVVILDEAHLLSKSAWSSLLKPIEEPPSHVYWMICTTDGDKVPATIRTRCIRYDLNPIFEDDILDLLKSVIKREKLDDIPNEIPEIISEYCLGSPRQALVYLEECLYCEDANEALNLIRMAGEQPAVIDLCRFLISRKSKSWNKVIKLLDALKGTDPESVRLTIVNYLSNALLNTKNKDDAVFILSILEHFCERSYNSSERFGPLLVSVGRILFTDEEE